MAEFDKPASEINQLTVIEKLNYQMEKQQKSSELLEQVHEEMQEYQETMIKKM